MPLPAEVLGLYQQPSGRALMLSTYCNQQGPQPAIELAEAVEQLFAKSGDLAHAFDAADLYVLGGVASRAAKLLAQIALERPSRHAAGIRQVLLRLAGARVALRLGRDFPAYLIDLSMRIGAPANERESRARGGAFLQLNSLTDLVVVGVTELRDVLTDAGKAVQLLSQLWGQCVIVGGSVGAQLQAILRKHPAPAELATNITRQSTFLSRASSAPLPPPSAPEAAWAQRALLRLGLAEEVNRFTPLHLVAAAATLDDALAELEQATSRLAPSAHLWAAKANVRFHRLLQMSQAGQRVDARMEIARILSDVKRALASNPHHIQALMVRGAIEADLEENPAAAIATYDSILEVSPFDPLALLYRAVNRARRGERGAEQDTATANFLLGKG